LKKIMSISVNPFKKIEGLIFWSSPHQKIDGGEDRNGPKTTQVRVCKKGPNKGSDVASATPIGDIVGRFGRVLMQLGVQIGHHVGGDSIVRKAFATLHGCKTTKVHYK